MAYARLSARSVAQLEALIRATARDSSKVIITSHASVRMRERRVSAPDIYDCLRSGVMRRRPEPNVAKGSLECRMEKRCTAGFNLGVVVALSDEQPSMIVVTVIRVQG